MHTTSMNVTILGALRSAQSVEKVRAPKFFILPKFVMGMLEYFSTPTLQKKAFALADACSKLQVVISKIQQSDDLELIDPNLETRDHLDELKKTLLEQRVELHESYRTLDPDGAQMPKLHKQVLSNLSLMSELHEVATELQWAIAEHDATYSPRLEGLSASSADELEGMLKRISAEA